MKQYSIWMTCSGGTAIAGDYIAETKRKALAMAKKEHTAGILLRELVGEGKMQKFGRGAVAVWKIAQECQKLHKQLTKREHETLLIP